MRVQAVTLAIGLWFGGAFAQAQLLTCDTASRDELESAMAAHNEHVARLERKFADVWYFQGRFPAGSLPKIDLPAVARFIATRAPRRTGVLFYASRDDRLCTWLLTPGGEGRGSGFHAHAAALDGRAASDLRTALRAGLGLFDAGPNRRPMPKRGAVAVDSDGPRPDLESTLEQLSRLLLPDPIANALVAESIDTLVLVPASIAYSYTDDRARAQDLVVAVGSVPFSLLRVGERRDRSLLDLASVVVAPGFASLLEAPRRGAHSFADPLVLGDPAFGSDPDWDLPRLPFAGREVAAVADILGTTAVRDAEATRAVLLQRLQRRSGTVDLIHIATHGIADAENPLDGSFLALAGGRLTAREIGELRLTAGPLVVLSACDTGLGKDFEVGTIGLARAWRRAGASDVVMSLWKVDDAATARLMSAFITGARSLPPDRALQRAMRQARDAGEAPAHWASFTLFGVP